MDIRFLRRSSCFFTMIKVTPVQWWVKGKQSIPFSEFDNFQKQSK